MAPRRAVLALTLIALALPAAAAAQDDVTTNGEAIADPEATVPGVTPTPTSTATPLPWEPQDPEATATPAGRDAYITPGYGSAEQQSPGDKRRERDRACDTAERPPTSHMLGIPGVVPGGPSDSWVPIVLAVALGAAIFAVVVFTVRRRGEKAVRPGPLEGVATLLAICGGLAALAAQFIPAASVEERPSREATLLVRDVKPRITRGEYLVKMELPRQRFRPTDLDEVGNVVWLEIGLRGFRGRPVRLEYGLYDLDAREALLPGTSKAVSLRAAEHDEQTLFFPAWVGYPRSRRFKAEFRLIDAQGVQQLAATGPMRGSAYRYSCERDD